MFSYYGSQYGCNPKYITDYILSNYPSNKFDVVWAFNNPKSKAIEGIRKVKTMSIRYFYELCTAKVILTNFRTTELFVKRKNQYYIQTWHSSLRLKHIEKDAENILPQNYLNLAKKDSTKVDLLLSGCKYSTEIFKRSFWYDGEIFEHGTPRNDFLFQSNSEIRNQIVKKLSIGSDIKIMLYAPTFRASESLEVYDLDYRQISEKLKSKFGGEWRILVKLHPHLISKSSQLLSYFSAIDVTSYDDIQELLVVADALITDYSSLMFDYSITKRPCFLYVPDINEYTSKERKLYFEIEELPFINATSNSELIQEMERFNNVNYQENLTRFLDSIGSFENGDACKNLLYRIDKVCYSKVRSEMLETV
ncbi:glycerophosphotransferase [Aquibacillus halophilus]|uniref:Glycerophosphotransferase n=2 Tax=Aquibacillus halophilus TaxID=930132 RepID=A0A6A8DFQ5_9BACI|nr:glycerophosphotransferase [Aquibacillus halophilus]